MQRLVRYTEPRVYLKSRKFSLFLQAQLDFALNSLEIHKGFLRLFALNPACACEIFVIFFVFRYTSEREETENADLQHGCDPEEHLETHNAQRSRAGPALLLHRSGGVLCPVAFFYGAHGQGKLHFVLYPARCRADRAGRKPCHAQHRTSIAAQLPHPAKLTVLHRTKVVGIIIGFIWMVQGPLLWSRYCFQSKN